MNDMGTFSRIRARAAREIATRNAHRLLATQGAVVGHDLTAHGTPIVSVVRGGFLTIGDRVVLTSDSRFTALGVSRPVLLRVMAPGARIRIGNDVGISGAVICAAGDVRVGDEVLLGSEVMIFDTPFHPLASEGRRRAAMPAWHEEDRVVINDRVFIGARAMVLPGVQIGEGSVIGAGSVVTRDVPPGVLAVGNPCRVVREL